MRKSKILGIALAAAMLTSVAATATFGASASVTGKGIEGETVGITGSFQNWGQTGEKDIPMTDDDGDGVWEGTIHFDSVDEKWLGVAETDDGDGNKVPRTDITEPALTFKIRTNGDWGNSWGDFEPKYNRTWDSQTNCAVVAKAGEPITVNVKLDTTKIYDQSAYDEEDRYEEDGADRWNVWVVSYEVVPEETTGGDTTGGDTTGGDTTGGDTTGGDTTGGDTTGGDTTGGDTTGDDTTGGKDTQPAVVEKKDDETPVKTGDTASAAALVAVVLASLGTAVVMTKKASAKD